jgi:hypothetical protein
MACTYASKAQCPAATALVIHSVTPTESRCPASGSAIVSVSGGSAQIIGLGAVYLTFSITHYKPPANLATAVYFVVFTGSDNVLSMQFLKGSF